MIHCWRLRASTSSPSRKHSSLARSFLSPLFWDGSRWAKLMTNPLCPKPAWLSLRLSFHLGRRRFSIKKMITVGGTRLFPETDGRFSWGQKLETIGKLTVRRCSHTLPACLPSSIHHICMLELFNPHNNPPTPLTLHAAFVEPHCSRFWSVLSTFYVTVNNFSLESIFTS